MRITALLLPAVVVLSGCIRPVIPGTCVEVGISTSCYSTRYTTNCYTGPQQVCRHQWFWNAPHEETNAEAYRRVFGREIDAEDNKGK